jgi:hypothetical protein
MLFGAFDVVLHEAVCKAVDCQFRTRDIGAATQHGLQHAPVPPKRAKKVAKKVRAMLRL